jgi:ribosomal-protein-alanine N-acetyltransferase
MRIRAATPADAPAIASLEGWTEVGVLSTLAGRATLAFVADREGEILGDVLATCVADSGEIIRITVRADLRRQGIAGRLLAAVEDVWGSAGVVEAWLEVRVDNAPAIALYERRGWTPVHRRPRYYSDGTDALMMRWTP